MMMMMIYDDIQWRCRLETSTAAWQGDVSVGNVLECLEPEPAGSHMSWCQRRMRNGLRLGWVVGWSCRGSNTCSFWSFVSLPAHRPISSEQFRYWLVPDSHSAAEVFADKPSRSEFRGVLLLWGWGVINHVHGSNDEQRSLDMKMKGKILLRFLALWALKDPSAWIQCNPWNWCWRHLELTQFLQEAHMMTWGVGTTTTHDPKGQSADPWSRPVRTFRKWVYRSIY